MKDRIQKTGSERKREKPVVGTQVAKDLLLALREMRMNETKSITAASYRNTEEIEAWENIIRENVKAWRTAPREKLDLDRETAAALDDACLPNPGEPVTDNSREWRRLFALRALKAVCQAWVNWGMRETSNRPWESDYESRETGPRPHAFAVTLREMTEDEKVTELMAMQASLKGSI